MGLLGAGGALPAAYGEQLAAHEAQCRDRAAHAFLDIFQHRAVTLFHAAWRKHRLPLQADGPGPDGALPLLLSLAGLGQPGLRDRLHAADGGVADAALAHYAGLLQRRGADACELQGVLADYLGVPVRIEQFVGRWCALDGNGLSRLGRANATLDCNAVLGARTWQRELRLRVVLGPLGTAQQQRFLPGQPGQRALEGLLALMAGVSLEWEIRLRLHRDAVAPSRLAGGPAHSGTRLGWNSFLLSQPSPAEREEPVYELYASAASRSRR
jgi:type VI secretion system protein ImpH